MKRDVEIAVLLGDGIVHGDELGAVGERALDLHLVDHLGDAGLHLRAAEELPTEVHQLGDRAPVAHELEELARDEGDGLGVVEPEPAREALLREEAGLVQCQLVDLLR